MSDFPALRAHQIICAFEKAGFITERTRGSTRFIKKYFPFNPSSIEIIY